MNAGVSSETEKVKESQSQSRSVTPPPDTPSGAGSGASQILLIKMSIRGSTTSSLQDRRHCAPLYLPTATVSGRAHPSGLSVL